MTTEHQETRQQGGLFASLKNFLCTLVDILHTRLEILGVELAEEKLRLVKIAVLAVATLVLTSLGLVFLSVLVITVFWETNRLLAISGVAAFYIGLGLIFGNLLKQSLQTKSKLFATSLAELDKDRAKLTLHHE